MSRTTHCKLHLRAHVCNSFNRASITPKSPLASRPTPLSPLLRQRTGRHYSGRHGNGGCHVTGNVNNLIGAAVTPRSEANWFNFSDVILFFLITLRRSQAYFEMLRRRRLLILVRPTSFFCIVKVFWRAERHVEEGAHNMTTI